MGVPIIDKYKIKENPLGDDTNSGKTSGSGKKTSSSSKPSGRGEKIELTPKPDISTAFDLAAEKSKENVIDIETMPFRNDNANYIYKTSNGEPRKTNESTEQDKISKLAKEQDNSTTGNDFFDMGFALRRALNKKRQSKAEKGASVARMKGSEALMTGVGKFQSAFGIGDYGKDKKQQRKTKRFEKRKTRVDKRRERRTY